MQRAIQSLKDAGVQNIECKLYPGARHELLVETNHQEVFEDIGSWLEKASCLICRIRFTVILRNGGTLPLMAGGAFASLTGKMPGTESFPDC